MLKTLLFLGLIIAGVVPPAIFLLGPTWAVWTTRTWAQTPCTVVDIGFTQGGGKRRDRVTCHVRYAYRADGREVLGDRLGLHVGDGDRWNLPLVEAHPAGTRSHCFVDPADPTDPTRSVFRRTVGTQAWLVGGFSCVSLILTWLGIAGLRDRWRPAPRAPEHPTAP